MAVVCLAMSATPAFAAPARPSISASGARMVSAPVPSAVLGRQAAVTGAVPSALPSGGTGTLLPFTRVRRMVVDDAHAHVFVTGFVSSGGRTLAVLDFAGNIVPTGLTDEAGASGMVVDGSTLYLARCSAGKIDEIDTGTLTRTGSLTIPVDPTDGPCNLALAGGRLWFTPNDQWSQLTSVDPSNGTVVSHVTDSIYNAAFATASGNPDLLYASDVGESSATGFVYDVSGPEPVLVKKQDGAGSYYATLTSDGADVLVPVPGGVVERNAADLSLVKTFTSAGPFGGATAVSADDGHVASVVDVSTVSQSTADVWVFPANASAPNRRWRLPEADSSRLLWTAFAGDDSRLFVVTDDLFGGIRFHALAGPTMQATTLTVSASRASIAYGTRTTITAHLSAWGTNRRVTIWRKPYGGRARTVAAGSVSSNGAFSTTVRPKKNTVYWATYAGDSAYVKSTSANRQIIVHVIVRGALSGYYAVSGGFHLYRSSIRPVYRATVTPAHPGACITFVLEVHRSSGWYYGTRCFAMNRKGKAGVYLTGLKIGKQYRIGAAFQDKAHGPGGTPWSYLRVTR